MFKWLKPVPYYAPGYQISALKTLLKKDTTMHSDRPMLTQRDLTEVYSWLYSVGFTPTLPGNIAMSKAWKHTLGYRIVRLSFTPIDRGWTVTFLSGKVSYTEAVELGVCYNLEEIKSIYQALFKLAYA